MKKLIFQSILKIFKLCILFNLLYMLERCFHYPVRGIEDFCKKFIILLLMFSPYYIIISAIIGIYLGKRKYRQNKI